MEFLENISAPQRKQILTVMWKMTESSNGMFIIIHKFNSYYHLYLYLLLLILLADGTYQRCGKDYINVDKGGFTSPKYPSNYPAESHCTWKITVRRGAYISVTFTDIDIEGNTRYKIYCFV